MKKTLIASAIAATTFAGTALAQGQDEATPADLMVMLENMPTIYGNVQLVYTYTDSDLAGSGGQLRDNGSTIGVKHSAEIAPGVEAFGKIELEGINADDKGANGEDNSGLNELDEAYIGVRGDSFGEIWVGSDDSAYERLIGDYGNWIYEVGTLNPYTSYTTGEGDLVQYMSPSFGGLTFNGAVQINGSADDEHDENSYPYQLAASYSIDTLTMSLVMDSNDSSTGNNNNSYGVAFEYGIDNLVLDAYYDHREGVEDATINDGDPFAGQQGGFVGDAGRDQFGLMGTYSIGPNTFRLSYEFADADTVDFESDILMLQALHNLNENMYVYVEAGQRNNEADGIDEEINQGNVGAVYYF
jgi:predicted porin